MPLVFVFVCIQLFYDCATSGFTVSPSRLTIANLPRWEKDGQVSREVWLKAGEQGLLGVGTPAEHGGIGGDWLDASIVLEEQ